ncbi:MAG: response regulator [Gemmatimonadaceae bacterium]|nr:response regulator [Gemmatimonadaceae bacterium]
MKIFVVDDDPFALRLITRQLELLGYTDVTAHQSAKPALEALRQDPQAADAVLLDLAMPDLDGMECLQELAKLKYPGRIVFISGMDEGVLKTAPLLARGLHLQAAGAIKKPSTPEQLQRLLGDGAST